MFCKILWLFLILATSSSVRGDHYEETLCQLDTASLREHGLCTPLCETLCINLQNNRLNPWNNDSMLLSTKIRICKNFCLFLYKTVHSQHATIENPPSLISPFPHYLNIKIDIIFADSSYKNYLSLHSFSLNYGNWTNEITSCSNKVLPKEEIRIFNGMNKFLYACNKENPPTGIEGWFLIDVNVNDTTYEGYHISFDVPFIGHNKFDLQLQHSCSATSPIHCRILEIGTVYTILCQLKKALFPNSD